ncbi:MAG: hypothetical protein HQ521_02635 [Bacteroidetes bacterium]|nr:hypothetical protein [Bacteroidota bacterium]
MKIFVKIDEKTRKERFIEFYRKKGVSEKNIQNLYDQRMLDEYEFVMESGNKADFIISE